MKKYLAIIGIVALMAMSCEKQDTTTQCEPITKKFIFTDGMTFQNRYFIEIEGARFEVNEIQWFNLDDTFCFETTIE